MVVKTQKFFIFSLAMGGTLALLSGEGFAKRSLPSAYLASDSDHYTRAYNKVLARFSRETNLLSVPEFDRVKAIKPTSKKSNSFGGILDFSVEAVKLMQLATVTNGIVDGYQSKIPGLLAKKNELGGTVRTKVAFGRLIDDAVFLIQNEGKKVRSLPYFKSGGSYTEDLTAYQMQVNCSLQGIQTVEEMLLSGKNDVVCRKVLETYYPKEEVQQRAPSSFAGVINWLTSRVY